MIFFFCYKIMKKNVIPCVEWKKKKPDLPLRAFIAENKSGSSETRQQDTSSQKTNL